PCCEGCILALRIHSSVAVQVSRAATFGQPAQPCSLRGGQFHRLRTSGDTSVNLHAFNKLHPLAHPHVAHGLVRRAPCDRRHATLQTCKFGEQFVARAHARTRLAPTPRLHCHLLPVQINVHAVLRRRLPPNNSFQATVASQRRLNSAVGRHIRALATQHFQPFALPLFGVF